MTAMKGNNGDRQKTDIVIANHFVTLCFILTFRRFEFKVYTGDDGFSRRARQFGGINDEKT